MARKNEPGYVYVFSNKSLPYLKIGHTKNSPKERARQLTKREKRERPFNVEWAGRVKSCYDAEQFLLKHFKQHHVEREFFDIDKQEAINLLRGKFGAVEEAIVRKGLLEGRPIL